MDIYEQSIAYFSRITPLNTWEDAKALFYRVAVEKPSHWLLPVRACKAVGGTPEQAVPALTAVGCAHVSIILVDDMLDSDPRGEYHRIGAPAAANLACAFQAASLEAIVQSEGEPLVRSLAFTDFNQMYLMTSLGQYLDVQCPDDEESYWRMVRAKSSPFFGTALHVGALLGGASVETARRLKELGNLYGEMIQIHDDLSDTMASPANSDWLQGRSPLPILFAKAVDHSERSQFLELCGEITDEDALREAQNILVRCGAVSYCVDQLLRRHQSAREALRAVDLTHPELIETLLDEVIAPVWKLFDALGLPSPQETIP